MFRKGDLVVSGKNGVCKIVDVGEVDFLWAEKGRYYFILQPVYSPASKTYIPVDKAESLLRRAMNQEEAAALIADIPQIDLIPITNEKVCEDIYKECLRKNECREWVRILKTTYSRKQTRSRAGRKIAAVDNKYFKLAEESLYGEIAQALGIPREEVEDYIRRQVEEKK